MPPKFVLIDQDTNRTAAEELAIIRPATTVSYTIGREEIIRDLGFYITPVEILAGILMGPFSILPFSSKTAEEKKELVPEYMMITRAASRNIYYLTA